MDNRTTIRNIDKELYKQAQKDAIEKGLSIGHWLNMAMKLMLRKEKKC